MTTLPAVTETKESTHEFPLRLGTPEDFARVESLLKSAHFDEQTVCRTLKILNMAKLSSIKPEEIDLSAANSELFALFVRIFFLSELVRCEEVERLIDAPSLESLLALGILKIENGLCYSPVFLYPVAGLLIASDRHNNSDGSPFTPPPDIVFPAINAGTLCFLNVIAKSQTVDVLDLGTGSGIAALLLSKHASHVVASDITPRSVHFAKFNCLLNGCYNVEVVEGDLYAPVEDRMFDRIVAHPPYVPVLHKTMIYRDGGETGELLIRRIIEGLPRHLRPGGTYYSVCIGLDTKERRFEERAREWLGESQDEFDIIFALGEERSAKRFARDLVEAQHDNYSDIERWDQIFAGVGVSNLVYGALAIHRRAEKSSDIVNLPKPLTVRKGLLTDTEGGCFERELRWHHFNSRPTALEELSQFKPSLSPHLKVKVTHKVSEGRLVPANFFLDTERPFPVLLRVDPWVIPIVMEFDGKRTVSELYQVLKEASALPEMSGKDDFINFVSMLIGRGYLEIEEVNF